LKQKPITRSLTEQKKNEKSDRKINTREKRMTNKPKTQLTRSNSYNYTEVQSWFRKEVRVPYSDLMAIGGECAEVVDDGDE